MNKSILIYIHFIKVGGVEKLSLDYINYFISKGYNVDLLIDYNLGRDDNILEKDIPNSINYVFLKPKFISKIIYSLRNRSKDNKIFFPVMALFIVLSGIVSNLKVRNIIRKNSYATTITFFHFLPFSLLKSNSNNIIWVQGALTGALSRLPKLYRMFYLHKISKFDKIVTISSEMKEDIENVYPCIPHEKLKFLYHPVDKNKILSLAKNRGKLGINDNRLIDSSYFCTICRLDEGQKDVQTLLLAFSSFVNRCDNDINLVIIGDGPSRKKLEKLTRELNLENVVYFLGYKDNPYIWMKQSKGFILSSKLEGLPTILVESLFMDVPVIASSCKTGPEEILQSGKSGWLFPVGSSLELSEILWEVHHTNYQLSDKIENVKKHRKLFESEYILNDLLKLV